MHLLKRYFKKCMKTRTMLTIWALAILSCSSSGGPVFFSTAFAILYMKVSYWPIYTNRSLFSDVKSSACLIASSFSRSIVSSYPLSSYTCLSNAAGSKNSSFALNFILSFLGCDYFSLSCCLSCSFFCLDLNIFSYCLKLFDWPIPEFKT